MAEGFGWGVEGFRRSRRYNPPALEFVDEACIINADYRRPQRRVENDADYRRPQWRVENDADYRRPQRRVENENGGLSEEFIERNMRNGDGNFNLCVVCQDDSQQRIGKLKCGHEFHATCITAWLRRKNICPLCKATALNDGYI